MLIAIFTLSGCYNAPESVKPGSILFKQMPKDGPNDFKRGWRDGCESGLSSMTNTAFKTFYSFKQDPQLRKKPMYYKTWKDTYTFCRHYIYGTLRQGNQRMNLPNKPNSFLTSFMGAEGIFEVGILNMWGPGAPIVPFNSFGGVGGDKWLPMSIGGMGTLDFSDDYVMNGKKGGMNMDFSSEAPFFGSSTIDRPMYVPKMVK